MIADDPYRARIRVPDEDQTPAVDHELVSRSWRRYRRVTIEFRVVLCTVLLSALALSIAGRVPAALGVFVWGAMLTLAMRVRLQFCRCPHCRKSILGGPRIEGRRAGPVRFPRACTHCG